MKTSSALFQWLKFAQLLLVVAVGLTFAPKEAHAIPVFAREYGVPCETCHVTITRRNEFGDLFRKWGYHWPGQGDIDNESRKQEPVEMSPSLFANVLPSRAPLSVIGTMSASYTTDKKAENDIAIGSPGLNFVLGGTYGRHLGFWGTWPGSGSPNEFYMHISRVADRPELNFLVGRFEQSTTVFKLNESYLGRYTLGTSALNGHAVSSGRNGVEWNGMFFDRAFLALGAVQQAGVGSFPATYYHVGTKFGGINYAGREPKYDLDSGHSFLDDLVLNIDHWGYRTKLKSTQGEETTEIRRIGLDAKLRYKEANLWFGSMLGSDVDRIAKRPLKSFTYFGEASYNITSWLTAVYLYQYQDATQFEKPLETHEGGLLFLPYQNIRVRASGGHSSVNDETVSLQVLMGL